jgi:hypothetical protein
MVKSEEHFGLSERPVPIGTFFVRPPSSYIYVCSENIDNMFQYILVVNPNTQSDKWVTPFVVTIMRDPPP